MRRKLNMFMALGLGVGFAVSTAHALPLEEGLIAWWRMELKVGNIIPDASGNGHELTINGLPTFEDSVVIFNDDGTLEAADSDALDLMDNWSISLWAREDSNDHSPNTNDSNGWIQKIRNFHDSEGGWAFVSDLSRLRTGLFGSSNCRYDAGPLSQGTWTRITTTYDSATGTVSIYFNSSLEFQSATDSFENSCSMIANVYPVIIGGFLDIDLTRVPFCKGAMSDIRVYDRTLSDSEVGELSAMASPADSDGDGVPDGEDECLDSDLDPEIVIDACDTGVENQLLENGCTMADLITQCAEDVESHGAFVRCVAHLTNFWKCGGLITGEEKGAVQNCAGQSEIS